MKPKTAVCRLFCTSYCQCYLFWKKNPIIWILCLFGCLAVPNNPDK